MKRYHRDNDSRLLAEASPLDRCEALVSGRTTTTPITPACGEEMACSGRLFLPFVKSFATIRTDWHTPPLLLNFCTPTSSEKFHEITPAPLPRRRISASSCPAPCSEFLIHFYDAPANRSPDVLAVAPCAVPALAETPSLPEHGPSLVQFHDYTRRRLSHPPKSPFTVGLPPALFSVVSRSQTLAPRRLPSVETSWSRCFRQARPPPIASRTLLLAPGGDSANLPPCEFRRASA